MDQGPHDKATAWLQARLAYIRGLKQPTDQQRLLLLLADLPAKTPDQDRQLAALIRAERAAERYARARGAAARVVDAEKRAARKARDHELYKSAGLMIMAGLVDSRTGQPVHGVDVLLGALAAVANALSNPDQRIRFQEQGRKLLQQEQGGQDEKADGDRNQNETA